MDNSTLRLQQLWAKYLDQTGSAIEEAELQGYMNDPMYASAIKDLIDQALAQHDQHQPYPAAQQHSILSHIYQYDDPVKKAILWPKIAVAAAIATIIFGAGLFLYQRSNTHPNTELAYQNDVPPGKQGATLTLARGKTIKLSEIANGALAKQSGVTISKAANGQLIYEISKNDQNSGDQNAINTLSTAKGETYQLRLPDGSLVWLNAASSLTYRAHLTQRGRRWVKLVGEAYFQIAKDKSHPFLVESQNQLVEVLGTHFNISAYSDDQQIKTTLLEGSVKVSTAADTKIISPNQETTLKGNQLRISQVNASDAAAWKDGNFVFDDEPLQSILKRVERWYNVEIIYEPGVNKNELYGGAVSRYDQVSKVLQNLEATKTIHFKIQGRRITVMK